MRLTPNELSIIKNFFNNSELSDSFVWLFNRQIRIFPNTMFVKYLDIIGFKCPNERFRVYCAKNKSTGRFYIKFYGTEAIPFRCSNYKKYVNMLAALNYEIDKDSSIIKYKTNSLNDLSDTIEQSQSPNDVPIDINEVQSQNNNPFPQKKLQIRDSEKRSVLISNLDIHDIDTIKNQLHEFEQDGITMVNIRISYNSKTHNKSNCS